MGEGNGVSEILESDAKYEEIKNKIEEQSENEQAIQQQNAAAQGIESGSKALGNVADVIEKVQGA